MDCSMCTFIGFLFNCIYQFFLGALEYPIVVLALSFLIGLAVLTNVQCAKQICNFGFMRRNNIDEEILCNNFDYGPDRGPHNWNCSNVNQSPINIISDNAQRLQIREPLIWNHYDDLPASTLLENNGHTVVMRLCYSGNSPTISGADLLASYTFVELCFRWSQVNTEGSEHMLNYRKFPLELQVMHRTGPGGRCTSSYDLLIISYFFEISQSNPYLDPLVQNLHLVQRAGSSVEIPPFPLSYLCHSFRSGFFSYGGSLTEPPCYQGAEWFVFPEALSISQQQMNEFRKLLCRDNESRILRNSRPVQSVGCGRVINFNQYNSKSYRRAAAECEEEEPLCEHDENCD